MGQSLGNIDTAGVAGLLGQAGQRPSQGLMKSAPSFDVMYDKPPCLYRSLTRKVRERIDFRGEVR